MERTVAVVGGGLSGLAIAEAVERLSKQAGQPVRAIIIEAEREIGGKIRSLTQEGCVLETGPHGFLDREPKMFALIDRLGLGDQLIRANESSAKRYIIRSNKLRALPTSPPAFLFSGVLGALDRLRVLLEPWAARRPETEESVRQFAARRIGEGAADVLVDAMVTGIYGGDPRQLSLRWAFPRMFELESQYGGLIKAQLALARAKKAQGAPKQLQSGTSAPGAPTGTLHSFERGLGTLITALGSKFEIRSSFQTDRIVRDQHFHLQGPKGAFAADALALAVPAPEAARLLAPHINSQVLGTVPYAPIAVVIHVFRSADVGRPLDGFGFLIPHRENKPILGSIWASTVFPAHAQKDRVMLRTMIGGARNAALAALPEPELLALARTELAPLLRISKQAEPLLTQVFVWPQGIPQYNLGHGDRVAAADDAERQIPGLVVAGNAFRGVAMLDCVSQAEPAAERLLRHVLK